LQKQPDPFAGAHHSGERFVILRRRFGKPGEHTDFMREFPGRAGDFGKVRVSRDQRLPDRIVEW
jgi:hypothetical protein